ncbi:MAG: hypothetical protein U9Q71_09265, partial [Pseudomonadota bacterium]|nr:hypothetical protein [Pseudomonadota bacterium]
MRQWRPSPPVSFTVRKPKAREIHAAAFPDRVVHHYLTPKLESLYEPVFIHDVYSNRKGKGTHSAVARLQGFMRSLRAEIAASPAAPRNDGRIAASPAAPRNDGRIAASP